MNTRLAAAKVVRRVETGESLDAALPAMLENIADDQHRVVQALSYGVLRQYELLQALLRQLLKKPLKEKDGEVTALLQCGLFELLEARTPDYAIVSETVKLVRKQRSWAAGLANACLRRFIRERETLLAEARQDPCVRYLLPEWLLTELQQAWPEAWQAIAKASNIAAPMTLRVNLDKTTREQYQNQLGAAGIHASVHPVVESALLLGVPQIVKRLPGFENGMASVQDAAAQLAGALLDVKPGQRLLDACAAPGGKTVHLLELGQGSIDLLAVDVDASRLTRVKNNLARGGYQATLLTTDAGEIDGYRDGQLFDRILLDAPCSATGVIRRHPDIKRHRQPADIEALCARQARLLQQLWQAVTPGGLLLYATCSILPQENSDQIVAFLQHNADAREKKITVSWGQAMQCGRQIFPGEADMDGFYYACLQKI